jgi:hypothetical protein
MSLSDIKKISCSTYLHIKRVFHLKLDHLSYMNVSMHVRYRQKCYDAHKYNVKVSQNAEPASNPLALLTGFQWVKHTRTCVKSFTKPKKWPKKISLNSNSHKLKKKKETKKETQTESKWKCVGCSTLPEQRRSTKQMAREDLYFYKQSQFGFLCTVCTERANCIVKSLEYDQGRADLWCFTQQAWSVCISIYNKSLETLKTKTNTS